MKNKKFRKYIFLILILFLSIGFAVLTTNLSINGLFNFTPNTWNIYLDNVVVDKNSTTTELPTINSDKNTLSFTSILNKPGDFYAFNVDVKNDSTIDAMLGSITVTGLDEVSNYLDCIVTYSNGTTPNPNDILYKTARVTFNVKLVYKDITKEQIPSEALTPTVTVTINYRQANNNAVIVSDINHWNFDFTGSEQKFNAPANGNYKIELWGASGGGSIDHKDYVGLGAYTYGNINLTSKTELYIYVGQEGISDKYPASAYQGNIESAYNGGGSTGSHQYVSDGSGGGATDIRIIGGQWSDFASLKSRIMVAAGGGGQAYWSNVGFMKAGSAGGLFGYEGNQGNRSETAIVGPSTGGTQILGGLNNKGEISGQFGHGGNGSATGAGGGGYYGGAAGVDQGYSPSAGAGGSSFISGHAGCVAITEASTEDDISFVNDSNGVACNDSSSTGYNAAGYNTDVACSKHYSEKVFTNTVMIDGKGYQWTTTKGSEVVGMPTHDGKTTMIGNTGNGFAKITLIN